MNALTETVQILRDPAGHPAFAVLPFAHYQNLIQSRCTTFFSTETGIPAAVVEAAIRQQISAARAWRLHLHLTQAQVAKRMGVNCKQSVSKLRKIAKNSSGERARMAHWCANMKAGKKNES